MENITKLREAALYQSGLFDLWEQNKSAGCILIVCFTFSCVFSEFLFRELSEKEGVYYR